MTAPAVQTGRAWRRAGAAVFRRTTDRYGKLHNFAAGLPLRIGDVVAPSSEALFQTFRFPHLPEVQRAILAPASAADAKAVARRHLADTRPDWRRINVPAMRWIVTVKLAQHPDTVGSLLMSTAGMDVVEESTRDAFWGATPRDAATLLGDNMLGVLWMQVRDLALAWGLPKGAPPTGVPDASLLGIALDGRDRKPAEAR